MKASVGGRARSALIKWLASANVVLILAISVERVLGHSVPVWLLALYALSVIGLITAIVSAGKLSRRDQ